MNNYAYQIDIDERGKVSKRMAVIEGIEQPKKQQHYDQMMYHCTFCYTTNHSRNLFSIHVCIYAAPDPNQIPDPALSDFNSQDMEEDA